MRYLVIILACLAASLASSDQGVSYSGVSVNAGLSDPLYAATAPFDMAPYSEAIEATFPTTKPSWPTPPTTIPGNDVTIDSDGTTDCAALDTALSTNQSHVTVTTDAQVTCTAAQMSIDGNDVWLEMQGAASITATNAADMSITGTRVKITGGILDLDHTVDVNDLTLNGSDVLIDNVVITLANNINFGSGATRSRVAIVNSTIDAYSYAFETVTTSTREDFILAGNSIIGDDPGETNCCAVARLQEMTRAIYANNRFEARGTPPAGFQSMRIWATNDAVLITDNHFTGTTSGVGHIWLSSRTNQNGPITNVRILGNTMYDDDGSLAPISQGYQTGEGPCELWVEDNISYSSAGSFVIGTDINTCVVQSNINNSVSAFSNHPFFPGFPTASELGVGADH